MRTLIERIHDAGASELVMRIGRHARRLRSGGRLGVGLVAAAALLASLTPGATGAEPPEVSETDPVARSARGRTIALFDDVARADRGFSLRAWVNDGTGGAISIGSGIAYHFIADRAAHLTIVHIDSHGVATVLLPNDVEDDDGGVGPLEPEVARVFPAESADFSLRAEPPVGQEHVIVVATASPIAPRDLGLAPQPDGFAVLEAADAPRLAARLLDLYLERPVEGRAAVHFEQLIAGRPGESEYSSVDIVDYFTIRTRSIQRPRLDLHIHFATNSDVLDDAARTSLDEVAAALGDPRLREMRFVVAGHTDAIGPPEYNDALSARRATSVFEYLTDSQGVAAERLEVSHHGELRPLESNATRDGRQMNRRVEFELLR